MPPSFKLGQARNVRNVRPAGPAGGRILSPRRAPQQFLVLRCHLAAATGRTFSMRSGRCLAIFGQPCAPRHPWIGNETLDSFRPGGFRSCRSLYPLLLFCALPGRPV